MSPLLIVVKYAPSGGDDLPELLSPQQTGEPSSRMRQQYDNDPLRTQSL